MVYRLLQKEFLDQILSYRFIILTALGSLIIWLSLYDGYTFYQESVDEYRAGQSAMNERIQQIAKGGSLPEYSGIGFTIHKPPSPLSIFVRGLEPALGKASHTTAHNNSRRMKRSPLEAEPILGLFPPLDLGLVVTVVLSLFVLLFTYDAVCGEKQGGTLRLATSFPVSKHALLLSKFFGSLVSLFVALGVPLLIGICLILLSGDVSIGREHWPRLIFIFVAFTLYLLAFLSLGIFGSSLTHRPATSFVLLLAVWVGTVVIWPKLSLVAADTLRPAISSHEFNAQREALRNAWMMAYNKRIREWEAAHPGWEATAEGRKERETYYGRARNETGDEIWAGYPRLEEEYENRKLARSELLMALARFSPTFALKKTTVLLSGTGSEREARFMEQKAEYMRGPNRTWYYDTSRRRTKHLNDFETYGEFIWDGSDLPRFTYQETWPPDDLSRVLFDIGMLALWTVLFFVCGYVATLRYDVR